MENRTQQRPARPGETCTCGRPATIVYLTAEHSDVPFCGVPHAGAPAPEPTNPSAPEWAERVLDALTQARALGDGDGKLTRAERQLLDGLFILLRARFGLSSIPDPYDVAEFLVEHAAVAIRAAAIREDGQP